MFALAVCRSTLDLELTNTLVDEAWNDATVGLSATPTLVAVILPWEVDCFSLLEFYTDRGMMTQTTDVTFLTTLPLRRHLKHFPFCRSNCLLAEMSVTTLHLTDGCDPL